MSFSNYLENILLDCIFGKMWYSPQALWVGFSSSDPLDTGLGIVEPPTIRGYQRLEVNPTFWEYAVDGVVANLQELTFNAANQDWPLPITHFVIWDTLWMIIYGELVTPRSIVAGQTPRFNMHKCEIFLD